MVVPRLSNTAVPVPRSAMRADAEIFVQRELGRGDIRRISKVEASVGWKADVRDIFQLRVDGNNTPSLLAHFHSVPFLVQTNIRRMAHDNLFTPNSVRSILTPIQYLRNRDTRLRLQIFDSRYF
jgi:hypothetical protein